MTQDKKNQESMVQTRQTATCIHCGQEIPKGKTGIFWTASRGIKSGLYHVKCFNELSRKVVADSKNRVE